MAKQYVLADEMFPTEFGPSFTAHVTLVAGTDNLSRVDALADFPSGAEAGCDSQPGTQSTFVDQYRIIHWRLGPYPCYTQFRTLADDARCAQICRGATIKAESTTPAFGRRLKRSNGFGLDRITPRICARRRSLRSQDIKDGKLAAMTWITPTKEDSDHPGSGTDRGPSWVGSIVNAIGQSKFWDSSAIVVVWDDWGGQYDNMPPPQLDFRGLGIRVPCLIVSPYAKENHVSHTIYEWGSILKFAEQVYGMPALGTAEDGYTDGRANSLIDSFNFNQSPRPFKIIPTKYKIGDF